MRQCKLSVPHRRERDDINAYMFASNAKRGKREISLNVDGTDVLGCAASAAWKWCYLRFSRPVRTEQESRWCSKVDTTLQFRDQNRWPRLERREAINRMWSSVQPHQGVVSRLNTFMREERFVDFVDKRSRANSAAYVLASALPDSPSAHGVFDYYVKHGLQAAHARRELWFQRPSPRQDDFDFTYGMPSSGCLLLFNLSPAGVEIFLAADLPTHCTTSVNLVASTCIR